MVEVGSAGSVLMESVGNHSGDDFLHDGAKFLNVATGSDNAVVVSDVAVAVRADFGHVRCDDGPHSRDRGSFVVEEVVLCHAVSVADTF